MRILIVKPGGYPRVADIPHTLRAMQEVVDGYIQTIYLWEDSLQVNYTLCLKKPTHIRRSRCSSVLHYPSLRLKSIS